jgi:hypothetical protein
VKQVFGDYQQMGLLVELVKMSEADCEECIWFSLYMWDFQ